MSKNKNNNKPKISIIVPAYNTEEYVGECLESIINCGISECEVIVVDDGSTDGTANICDFYSKKSKNIKVIHTKNAGVSNARNLGIKKTTGELVWFIDSDDVLKPNAINIIVDEMKNSDLLLFGIEEFDRKNKLEKSFKKATTDGSEIIERMLADDDARGYLFNKIFRLETIKKNRLLFDGSIDTCEDLLFCVQYASCIKKTTVINNVLYGYRQRHGGAMRSALNRKQSTALEAFIKIEKECKSNDSRIKARALFVKAYYKYRPILKDGDRKKYLSALKSFKVDYKNFPKKDRMLAVGYRFINPLMRLLHYVRDNNRNLYGKNKEGVLGKINKAAPFFVFASFYLGTINISMLSPIIVMGGVIFLLNLFNRTSMRRRNITKVEVAYFCFILMCTILICFSYDKIASAKQLFKIALLIFSFWQFIVYFRQYDRGHIEERFSVASIMFFIITSVLYIAGIASLEFNFNIDNVDILGVTIDRHMPRLISLAYNDPNITALFLSVPFTFFLSRNKTKMDRVGLIFSSVLLGLTVSRGAFVALIPCILFYMIFSKDRISVRILTIAKVVLSIGATLLLLINATSIRAANATVAPAYRMQRPAENAALIGVVSVDKNETNPVAEHFDFQAGGGSGRISLWKRGVEIINKHPITGIGLNNTFVYTEGEYHKGKYIHNTYIEIFMEEGILGGILYIFTIVCISAACWRLRKKTIFPALMFIFLFCAQVFLSVEYSEVFFAGVMVVVLYSSSINQNFLKRFRRG